MSDMAIIESGDRATVADWLARRLGAGSGAITIPGGSTPFPILETLVAHGGIDWSGHDQARGWYAVMKSRPSFRPLLAEKMDGLPPPAHYALVDS